jgi:hypothetical protein
MVGKLSVGASAASGAIGAPTKPQAAPTPMAHASSEVQNAKGIQSLALVSVKGTVKNFELTAIVVPWEVIRQVFEEA